jgi:hypothetical protein
MRDYCMQQGCLLRRGSYLRQSRVLMHPSTHNSLGEVKQDFESRDSMLQDVCWARDSNDVEHVRSWSDRRKRSLIAGFMRGRVLVYPHLVVSSTLC